MKETKLGKITKTHVANLLVWSSKANGIPKQVIIDEIFDGMIKGQIKKKGEIIHLHNYVDQKTKSTFVVDFRTKTIQQDAKEFFIFNLENAPKPDKIKIVQVPKLNKQQLADEKMAQLQNDYRDFLSKNFVIEFTPSGKVKKFEVIDKENVEMGVDVIYGGLMYCLAKHTGVYDQPKDMDKFIRDWVKSIKKNNPDLQVKPKKLVHAAAKKK